jgi:hypothetical protein
MSAGRAPAAHPLEPALSRRATASGASSMTFIRSPRRVARPLARKSSRTSAGAGVVPEHHAAQQPRLRAGRCWSSASSARRVPQSSRPAALPRRRPDTATEVARSSACSLRRDAHSTRGPQDAADVEALADTRLRPAIAPEQQHGLVPQRDLRRPTRRGRPTAGPRGSRRARRPRARATRRAPSVEGRRARPTHETAGQRERRGQQGAGGRGPRVMAAPSPAARTPPDQPGAVHVRTRGDPTTTRASAAWRGRGPSLRDAL